MFVAFDKNYQQIRVTNQFNGDDYKLNCDLGKLFLFLSQNSNLLWLLLKTILQKIAKIEKLSLRVNSWLYFLLLSNKTRKLTVFLMFYLGYDRKSKGLKWPTEKSPTGFKLTAGTKQIFSSNNYDKGGKPRVCCDQEIGFVKFF